MGQIQSIDDLLNFLHRRFWLILAVTVIGMAAAAFYAKSRPDTFESTAAIQVQGAQVGSDGMPAGSAQMLQTIEQQLTTRDSLLAVIRRHDVYAGMPLSDDEKVGLLRGQIAFQAIETAGAASYGQPAQISAILVTARAGSADQAARIANDFAQGILDMSSSGQIDRARDTLAFYQEEQAKLTADLTALEAQIAAYKNANAGALPAVADARREELVGIETALRELEQMLVALQQEQRQLALRDDLRATERRRLAELDAQISVMTEQKAALSAQRATVQSESAALPEVERVLSGMERDLALLQNSLGAVTGQLVQAETAQKLAERQQGQRFALLDRAVTPEYPINAGARKLFMAGTMAALMAGIGLAFLLDLMRPVVRTSAQMERLTGLRPVIAIPELDLKDPRKAFRRGPLARLFGAGLTGRGS